MRASGFLLVFSTAPNQKAAVKIADFLLDRKLASCVNISAPINSLYLWKGKKERAKEVLLLIKTRKSLYPKLQQSILKMHPYEVPEIIGISLNAGSPDYLSWVYHETKAR